MQNNYYYMFFFCIKDKCEDYLAIETIQKTSAFLESFLEKSNENKLVVLTNEITNNNNNNTILSSIIEQLSNQSHIQTALYNIETTLNASFINNIILSITGGVVVSDDVTTILVIASDAEWQLLNKYLAEVIDIGNLFWLRLATTTQNNHNYYEMKNDSAHVFEEKSNICTYEIPLVEILSGGK